ncbi:hypothetical protein IEN91_05250 [Bacillus velezensis]|uniref:hypothetical protein n=1 Tax=Bacillus velezensis TaxID=492670 RepID=UPI0018C7B12F|nr:hypothetical protein [Bacillus velezensis]QPK89845.1 hypothetical protein IEN91_05250 [Bacillus velezensis]
MTNTNDQRILKLKKQIEVKKEKLGKLSRFAPITNCSLEVDGVRFNINVLDKEKLIMLAVKINSYLLSAKDLGYENQFIISGYKVEDWLTDIQSRLDILSKKDEERSLKAMEDKLAKLLSEDKKVELEIDEIESLLKGE